MVLGLLRMIKLLRGEKHPETEAMERKKDELERIMREEPERFKEMVRRYSNELELKLWKNSGEKLFFGLGYTPMVAWEIVEDILKAGIELGILTKRRGIQGEYIDVNPEAVAKLGDDTYNLWAFWLARELGLPKEVWLDAARELSPNFQVWGESPAEIDGIRLYLKGKREEAIKLWKEAGLSERRIKKYDLYLKWFLERLERWGILEKARKIIQEKERQLAGAPRWFDEYLVKRKIGELERMERVHPDLFEVNVIIPLKTAYRAFDWMHKKVVQKGTLDLAEVEGYLNKIARKSGYDPQTVESIREEVKTWIRQLGEGRLTYRDLTNKIKNVKVTTESLMEKFSPLHLEKKQRNEPFTREEIKLVKEHVRRAAAPLKFV